MSKRYGKEVSLREFIEDNYKLITVIGIFGAVSTYFTSGEIDSSTGFLPYLGFASFSIFLLLCWELWGFFPKGEEATTRMHIFEALFMIFVFSVGYYILMNYKEIILSLSIIVFVIIYSFIFSKLIQYYKLYIIIRRVCEKYPKLDKLIRSVGALFVFAIAVILSYLSTTLLTKLLK